MYLWGCVAMGGFLLIIGGVSLIKTKAASWAVGSMLLAWNVMYQFSVGTIAFSLVTELTSRHLMVKTLNLGRALYNVEGIIIGSLNPYMLSKFFPANMSQRAEINKTRSDCVELGRQDCVFLVRL